MKTLNKVCQFLAIALGLASIVLFFLKFATFTFADGSTVSMVGAALGFGTKTTVAGKEFDMARSADILFCFWLSVIGFFMSIGAIKSKKIRYFVPLMGLGTGIYMLVIALRDAKYFVDARPLTTQTSLAKIEYAKLFGGVSTVLLTAICLFVFAIVAAAFLFIDDYIEVSESKGSKKTILKRFIGFLKDYKSEIKKIVWPGIKDVLKNTGIVLIMCLIVGLFIWGIDFGLGKLLELVLGA